MISQLKNTLALALQFSINSETNTGAMSICLRPELQTWRCLIRFLNSTTDYTNQLASVQFMSFVTSSQLWIIPVALFHMPFRVDSLWLYSTHKYMWHIQVQGALCPRSDVHKSHRHCGVGTCVEQMRSGGNTKGPFLGIRLETYSGKEVLCANKSKGRRTDQNGDESCLSVFDYFFKLIMVFHNTWTRNQMIVLIC